jgi:hypothetical protein
MVGTTISHYKVLASLDHPNIGQFYGIEDAGQTKSTSSSTGLRN